MPDTPETIFGIPFKMSDEPRPSMATADSLLSISNGVEEMELPLRMVIQSRRMYELLKDIEFVGDGVTTWCPDCGENPPGHTDLCRLAAVLKAVEGT
jgi:hypothetical protein